MSRRWQAALLIALLVLLLVGERVLWDELWDSRAYDCWPYCTNYQDWIRTSVLLVLPLAILFVLIGLLGIAVAALVAARRRSASK